MEQVLVKWVRGGIENVRANTDLPSSSDSGVLSSASAAAAGVLNTTGETTESAIDTRLGRVGVRGTRVGKFGSLVNASFQRSTIGDNT